MAKLKDIQKRLEYLRGEIKAERISYGEIAELQSLVKYIKPGDVELLEWAGVPEFKETKAKLRGVFDNGGKTFDRYTVIIDSSVFTMSSTPLDPGYGFNQYCCEVGQLNPEAMRGDKRVYFKDLPDQVKRAIKARLLQVNK